MLYALYVLTSLDPGGAFKQLRSVDQDYLERADSLGRSSECRREVGIGIAVVVCNYAFPRSRQPRRPRSPGTCPPMRFRVPPIQ